MRLPLISPANLTAEQRPLYEDMRRGIETNFKGFKAIATNGELVGPWNPWLHFPKFGGPFGNWSRRSPLRRACRSPCGKSRSS